MLINPRQTAATGLKLKRKRPLLARVGTRSAHNAVHGQATVTDHGNLFPGYRAVNIKRAMLAGLRTFATELTTAKTEINLGKATVATNKNVFRALFNAVITAITEIMKVFNSIRRQLGRACCRPAPEEKTPGCVDF